MKLITKIICISICLSMFGCENKKSEEIEIFNKTMEFMKENDSFEAEVDASYQVPGKNIVHNIYLAKINDYYDGKKSTGKFAFLESNDFAIDSTLYVNNVETIKCQNENESSVDIGYNFLYENFEFMNFIKGKSLMSLVYDNNNDINLNILLNLESDKKQKKYFKGNDSKNEDGEMFDSTLSFVLNKNYSIKECYFSYYFKSDIGESHKIGHVKFKEYGHQDIEFPN